MRSKTVHIIRCVRCGIDFHSETNLNETVWLLEDHGWRFQIGFPLSGGDAICDRHVLDDEEFAHYMTPHRTRRTVRAEHSYYADLDARVKAAQEKEEVQRRKRLKRQTRIKSWKANTLSKSSRRSPHITDR